MQRASSLAIQEQTIRVKVAQTDDWTCNFGGKWQIGGTCTGVVLRWYGWRHICCVPTGDGPGLHPRPWPCFPRYFLVGDDELLCWDGERVGTL
jgi:hypothetical protein